MFDINDTYTVSGGVNIFNYWNPFVTKHDTSSFYNWEQDNLPLYDLEERSFYLWEKLGYPLSSIPGMALVVSSTIPDSGVSANVFGSLSAAVEALPEIIRMPTIIEVTTNSNLGTLNLNNIKCEGEGVLEIVNRGFAPISNNAYSMYLRTDSAETNGQSYFPNSLSGDESGFIGTLSSTSAISVADNVAVGTMKYSDGIATVRNIILAGRGEQVAGGWQDRIGYSFVGANTGVTKYKPDNNDGILSSCVISHTVGDPVNSTVADNTIHEYDVSTVKEYDKKYINPPQYKNQQLARGIWSVNWLSEITAQNCDGPIYIRGFIVDGADATTAIGISIKNCNNLTLENCGVIRCTEVGFDIKNSNINLRRQAIASRNYNAADRGTLKTYGFKATDSEITFVTDTYTSGAAATLASHFHDYGIYLENSVLKGGDVIDNLELSSASYTDLGFNGTGLYCSNSKYSMNGVTYSYNNRNNIEARTSVVEVEQLKSCNAQKFGLLMDNSDFRYNKNLNSLAIGMKTTKTDTQAPIYHNYPILFSFNGQHISLQGGSTYGPTYPVETSGVDITTLYNQEVYYGNHKRAFSTSSTDSALAPGITIDNSVGEFTCSKFISTERTVAAGDKSVPRHLAVTNNGAAVVRGLTNNNANDNTVCYFDGPKQTECPAVMASNNSTIHFTGPVAIYNHGYGAIAENNSTIKAGPPLEESNSYISTIPNMSTPKDTLSFSGWGGGLYKATPVLEIHSQGAGLLAHNKSTISLEELGYASSMWEVDNQNDNNDYLLDNLEFVSLVSAGAVQFYPNRVHESSNSDDNLMPYTIKGEGDGGGQQGNFWGISVADGEEYNNHLTLDVALSCYRILSYNSYLKNSGTTLDDDIQKISTGGMCVRAVNDSSVKVRNVHFPMGHPNPEGHFYDASSSPAGCNNLLIWNIADISQLNAAYCVVSGMYPSQAGYTGPLAIYPSGAGVTTVLGLGGPGGDTSCLQYTLPSGTPDTGRIAVLDYYGSGANFINPNVYGLSAYMSSIQKVRNPGVTSSCYGNVAAAQNRGPFRLYFSVLPAAKCLSYMDSSAGISDNRPYQHLSQGYLLSGNCSAAPEFSGMYPQLINKRTYQVGITNGDWLVNSGTIGTSGYYYPSAMMPVERASVWLDESAANTFANAKHCNTDYSNRLKLVNIYRAKTDVYGEGYDGSSIGYGWGFRTPNTYDSKRRT